MGRYLSSIFVYIFIKVFSYFFHRTQVNLRKFSLSLSKIDGMSMNELCWVSLPQPNLQRLFDFFKHYHR